MKFWLCLKETEPKHSIFHNSCLKIKLETAKKLNVTWKCIKKIVKSINMQRNGWKRKQVGFKKVNISVNSSQNEHDRRRREDVESLKHLES